jgi:hypothetical protein
MFRKLTSQKYSRSPSGEHRSSPGASSFADDSAMPQFRFDYSSFAPVQLVVQANKPFKFIAPAS